MSAYRMAQSFQRPMASMKRNWVISWQVESRQFLKAWLSEDSEEDGRAAAKICTSKDALIAIAASGRTPYTIAAATEAKARGCAVISVVNVSNSTLGKLADVEIVLQSGAEVIAGST